jgi:DNA-binding PadR family transcriptional regulator
MISNSNTIVRQRPYPIINKLFKKFFFSKVATFPKPRGIVGKGETNKRMKGTYLGEFEELVLLAVGILFDDAYGLAVVDELEKQTGRNIMMSSVHKALVRLEDKGYLKSYLGGASEIRGGREKRLYTLTLAGKKVLNESRELRNSMWKEIPKIVWEGGKL